MHRDDENPRPTRNPASPPASRRRGSRVDENIAAEAAVDGRSLGAGVEESRWVDEVEARSGHKLSSAQRALVLLRRDAGESVAATADWLMRQEAARVTINDPRERRLDGTDIGKKT